MSLTNRVSAFFLAALAIVLVIYSLVFYSLTRGSIVAQFENELRGVLNSLVAAAEVEETEVKWQPLEHAIDVGTHDEFGAVQWVVVGDDDIIVERSESASDGFVADAMRSMRRRKDESPTNVAFDGLAVMSRQLSAPKPERDEREPDEFDRLTVFAGRSTVPRDAILFRLGLLVTLLPLIAWVLAALLGRWIVRQALRPVSEMARQAQTITGKDFESRLTHSDARDELTDLASAFNRLLDRQQAAYEQQRRFTGDAAHELRTPITVLLGQIDVTLRRQRTGEEYQSTLELLRSKAHALQEIVESLLFLARSHADADRPPLRPLDLRRWLASQAETWSLNSRSADLTLDVQLGEHAVVLATPALLGRVVDNLVSNAMKYSDAGTPVTVRARDAGEHLLIEVIDAGCGIDHDDLPRLFDPFFRSSEARRRGVAGTGLGLAIAHRIAQSLDGSLYCESTPGRGSCFRLRLPKVV
jgi:heavy metal sensor kinase